MRVLRRLAIVAAVLLGLVVVAGCTASLWLWTELRGSLPATEGEAALPGLGGEVRIERDALGIPRVSGAREEDVLAALGWLHAQERFFQMDLMRRRAAGELSELVGTATLELDRGARMHRFRWRAARALAALPAADRAAVEAYTRGVNAGRDALGATPFEYLLLRAEARPWRPEDSVLVLFNMFVELQEEDGATEASRGALHAALSPELAAFLDPPGTEWDAPIVGEPFEVPPLGGVEAPYSPPASPAVARAAPSGTVPVAAMPSGTVPVPAVPSGPPAVVGMGTIPLPSLERAVARALGVGAEVDAAGEPRRGSNNWAVSGAHTADGRAWLANDMHLGLQLPNIWYRAQLAWDGPAGKRTATGVTLPGAPGIVVGSNGRIAWGFTNSYGDWSDLVLLGEDPGRPGTYRGPGGAPRPFARTVERIAVKGADPVALEVLETVWGPVVGADARGRRRALRWTAHDVEAVNFGLVRMASADTLDEALALAAEAGIPAQNFVAADAAGHVGWTICGRIPRRFGPSGRLPASWEDGGRGWSGYLSPAEYPRVVDPPNGRVWTANARVVDGPMLAIVGDGGYALGARARQIRDDLLALEKATPQDLLGVQLDDRAVFLERWRDLLRERLDAEEDAPAQSGGPGGGGGPPGGAGARADARRLVEDWGGRASVESVGYRIVRAYRTNVMRDVWEALTRPCRDLEPALRGPSWQFEGPLWRLVSERPPQLVPPPARSWEEYLDTALDRTLAELTEGGARLASRTWGERNTVQVAHPLANGVPVLARWLDMPPLRLPGGDHMPRIQTPGEGASQRLVVSPGREEAGIFHMPGGQSGHPLSPHYGDGHRAWAEGEPTPFLPGAATSVLVLKPAPW